MIKICISVTSHMLLTPVTNCHTFSDPLSLERDVLYGRSHRMDKPITKTLMKVMFITSVKSGIRHFSFSEEEEPKLFPTQRNSIFPTKFPNHLSFLVIYKKMCHLSTLKQALFTILSSL